MEKLIKLISGSVLIIIFLVFSLWLPVVYIYKSGKDFIQEIQDQTRNRAMEIAIALDTMSGESIYYDNMISLSNVMNRIIEHINIRQDPYKIKEIFLLDSQNRLLAHSDIIKVAKDFRPVYDPEKYHLGEILFYGNPVQIETIGYAKIQLPPIVQNINSYTQSFLDLELLTKQNIKKYLPELLGDRFHVYTSVYPPDETMPKGSLHLIIENKGIAPLVSYWIEQMFYTAIVSILAFFFLALGFIILLVYVLYYKDKKEFASDVALIEEIKEVEKTPAEHSKQKENELLPEDELNIDHIAPEELSLLEEKEPDISESSPKAPVISIHDYKNSKTQEAQKKTLQKNEEDYENIMDALPMD